MDPRPQTAQPSAPSPAPEAGAGAPGRARAGRKLLSAARVAAGALLLGAALACNGDNPACIFGAGGCNPSGGGGGDGGDPGQGAALPVPGQWIVDGAPRIVDSGPSGAGRHSRTPIFVVFSESLNPDSLEGTAPPEPDDSTDGGGGGDLFGGGGGDLLGGDDGGDLGGVLGETVSAVQLVRVDPFAPTASPLPASTALVGDGRVLVLLPSAPLQPGDYQVRLASGVDLRDVTGEALTRPANSEVTVFSVSDTDPETPSVVGTYPADDASGQSPTGEVVVVFDRAMASSTVAAGWRVTVDGAPPAVDPDPVALSQSGGLIPVSDDRVYTWRSSQAGAPVSLGTDVEVELVLSPDDAVVAATDGGELDEVRATFRTTPVAAPTGGVLLSQPTDAIGAPNLTAGSGRELRLEVQLDGAQGGDEVTAFLIGGDLTGRAARVALRRERTVPGSGPVATVVLDRATLDLATADGLASDPPEARLAEGAVAIGLRLRRGSAVSPIGVVDVDLATADVQDPVLDLTPPELLDLVFPGGGNTELFLSDLRGLALAGTASEDVGAVEVRVAGLGDNGSLAPPPGVTTVSTPPAEPGGDPGTAFLFSAAPVPLGVLADGVPYEVVVYDRALNAAPAASGTYVQRGAVAGAAWSPGDAVTVRVYDPLDLSEVQDAEVLLLGDPGTGDHPLRDSGLTDAEGEVVLQSDASDVGPPILVVSALGSDVVVLDGWPATRVDVPLPATGLTGATVEGEVVAVGASAVAAFLAVDVRVGESRRAAAAPPVLAVDGCGGLPLPGQEVSCSFGVEPILAGRLGAQSFLAGTFGLSPTNFDPATFLQGFEVLLPLPAAFEAEATTSRLEVERMLTEPGVPEDELPVELPRVRVLGGADLGVDLASLDFDAALPAGPSVVVEALSPGVPGPVAVGLGSPVDLGLATPGWRVRSVLAGAADLGGRLVATGTLEPEVRLRLEVRDTAGRRSVRRPLRSAIESGLQGVDPLDGVPFTLPRVVTALVPDGAPAGGAFDLVVDRVLDPAAAQPGLVHVELQDAGGRVWRLYKPDPGAGNQVRVHVPDGASATTALATAAPTCVVEARAWNAFDPGEFLWSDLEREYDQLSRSAPLDVAVP